MQQALEFSGVDAIGVDGYSHKGQHYITVLLTHSEKNGSKASLLFAVEGKGKDAAKQFLETFKAKQGEPDTVGEVTCDLCHVHRNALEILNYFDSMKTNALLEGFNSMRSLIKYRARGFKNMENFMAMISFVCGELALPKATIM